MMKLISATSMIYFDKKSTCRAQNLVSATHKSAKYAKLAYMSDYEMPK